MKRPFFCFLLLSLGAGAQVKTELIRVGLKKSVEIIRDSVGVNHIYAQNEHDLFFAQGYCAAKDRLFQFELWRRQATGTMAELLGENEVLRDRGARLFKFRGNLQKEFNHYHPHGASIIEAFTKGINAYIKETEANPALLPLEFALLNTKPQPWTADIVISRHQGLLGNISEEVQFGRLVFMVGAEKLKELIVFEPGVPALKLDAAIDGKLLAKPVTELYDAFRKPLMVTPQAISLAANLDLAAYQKFAKADEDAYQKLMQTERSTIGSNNWIVSANLSKSGFPLLANDPHRALSVPSLRYMAHLHAPGWDVIGGGEPTIPGISIGHNQYGAWGLTVFDLDAEDLYVYEINPQNPYQYKYQNKWENMRVIKDTIRVKGNTSLFLEHKYTRHGPVTFEDKENHVAYAMRCGWMEIGGAPYMASLRIDQAKNWEAFKEACSYSRIPGENMIWADKKGNIGWQATGVAPVRENWDGLLPVPGDGRYEWSGYLPIKSLPSVFNPAKGFWATANENLIPSNYAHRNAVGWTWADSYRADRINELLASSKKLGLEDMTKLQFDYLSIPARILVPLLRDLTSSDEKTEAARTLLLSWNYQMNASSIEAGIYAAWEKRITEEVLPLFVPENAKTLIKSVSLSRIIEWIVKPNGKFGDNPIAGRNQFLMNALQQAVQDLILKLGADRATWQYGQLNYHHVLIKHPLSNAVNEATRKKLEVGPLPRGGNGATLGMTTNGDNQTAGASFRIAADLADWDKTLFTNAPGQCGDVASPFYKNLFHLWATDKHFPVYYSRKKIEGAAKEKLVLKPLR
jgi:penicillin G amidase